MTDMFSFTDDMPAQDFFLAVCTVQDGVLRWKSNDWVPDESFVAIAAQVGVPVDVAKCNAARALDNDKMKGSVR